MNGNSITISVGSDSSKDLFSRLGTINPTHCVESDLISIRTNGTVFDSERHLFIVLGTPLPFPKTGVVKHFVTIQLSGFPQFDTRCFVTHGADIAQRRVQSSTVIKHHNVIQNVPL